VIITSAIRQLYTPVQPSVKLANALVEYREFLPAVRLQQFIYCYWELKTMEALEVPYIYRVVADGCMDIFFEWKNPQDNYIMGFSRSYTEFPIGKSFHYIGIRFLPAMLPRLFRVNAGELSNRVEALHDVLPSVATFLTNTFNSLPAAHSLNVALDQYFLSHLSKTTLTTDNRVDNAIHIILQKRGVVNIETELDTGISPRQLRRLFEFYIGDSAKTFSKVVRFQNILHAKPSVQSLRQNKLFFDNGYYDQAHFIKDFKRFYGITPTQAFLD
jgi:AraC-like DNA-binding protein